MLNGTSINCFRDPDINRINASTRTIAVIMPNTQSVSRKDWDEYRTSIQEVEHLTGFDFFSKIPDNVESELEKKVDDTDIKKPKKKSTKSNSK